MVDRTVRNDIWEMSATHYTVLHVSEDECVPETKPYLCLLVSGTDGPFNFCS